MSAIYSIIDAAQHGLSVENIKSYVATQNISNANTPGYIPKAINANSLFGELLRGTNDSELMINKDEYVIDAPSKNISLDSEVVAASDAGLRYQVISEIIQKKFGLLDLVYGVKK